MDYREDSPEILLDFLSYHETIKAHSQRTNIIWTCGIFSAI